ncbi:hypothetical protein D3C81_1063100 [compost metagenome]
METDAGSDRRVCAVENSIVGVDKLCLSSIGEAAEWRCFKGHSRQVTEQAKDQPRFLRTKIFGIFADIVGELAVQHWTGQ